MTKAIKKLILNWLYYHSISHDIQVDDFGTGIMVREKDVDKVERYIKTKFPNAETRKVMDNLYVVYYNIKGVK